MGQIRSEQIVVIKYSTKKICLTYLVITDKNRNDFHTFFVFQHNGLAIHLKCFCSCKFKLKPLHDQYRANIFAGKKIKYEIVVSIWIVINMRFLSNNSIFLSFQIQFENYQKNMITLMCIAAGFRRYWKKNDWRFQ